MNAKTPRLLRGGLTGRIYIVTRYTETPDGTVIADEKHDVTDQFDDIITEAQAQALEAAADDWNRLDPDAWRRVYVTPDLWLRERAAAIREGDGQ